MDFIIHCTKPAVHISKRANDVIWVR